MKLKLIAALAGALLLQGCGTHAYKPTEYPLRDGLIPPIKAAGKATFSNAQDSTDEAIVYSYMGQHLASNYHDITELMVAQATKEFAKAATVGGGASKTISLKVTSLQSSYVAFFWNSKINFEAKLGNGDIVTKEVKHSSGNVIQDLNGCIAEGVLELFRDERVMSYLTR